MWRWRVACIVLAALCVFLWSTGHRAGRKETEARVKAATVETQQRVAVAAAKVETRTVYRERAVRGAVERSVIEIETAPGADTPLPADVRDAWVAGLERVRDAGADPDTDPGEPPH